MWPVAAVASGWAVFAVDAVTIRHWIDPVRFAATIQSEAEIVPMAWRLELPRGEGVRRQRSEGSSPMVWGRKEGRMRRDEMRARIVARRKGKERKRAAFDGRREEKVSNGTLCETNR